MNVFETGPMIGGISVDLGLVRAKSGREFMALLQFGGEVRHSGSSSSLVNGEWVSVPFPPTTHPIITLTPAGGGPRSTYAAASFIEAARKGHGFSIASLYEGVDVLFEAPDAMALAAQIEAAIPRSTGSFSVQWTAVEHELDFLPF